MAQQLAPSPPVEERYRMTFAEFLAWRTGSERRSEWVEGEVTVFAMPKPFHQLLIGFLVHFVDRLAEIGDRGDVYPAGLDTLIRDGRSLRQPDLVFVAAEHRDRVTEDWLEGAADLLVEVVSTDSMTRDRRDKYREYEEIGVPEYWIFDARDGQRGVVAHRLGEDGRFTPIPPDADGALRSAVLPGFFVHPKWLQRPRLPRVVDIVSGAV